MHVGQAAPSLAKKNPTRPAMTHLVINLHHGYNY